MQHVTIRLTLPFNPTAADFAQALSLSSAQMTAAGDVMGGNVTAQLGYVCSVASAYSVGVSRWAGSFGLAEESKEG